MGTVSFLLLGALFVVFQSPTTLGQEAPSRHKRETVEEDVPVIYFPRATEGLKRRKREWAISDINFPERDNGPFPKRVAQIRLNEDKGKKIHYNITGPGADQPPVDLFTIDRDTGILYVTQPLDREVTSSYTFMAHTVEEGSGLVENAMEIKVIVIDMNDNKPIFTQDTYTGQVAESSPLNFEILQVKATDADQEGSMNAAVHYRIMNQEPKSPADDMFAIDPVTGFIRVNATGLDREKNPKYTLEVEAADMEGEGLAVFTKVILTVTDSNDNAPIYTQTQSPTTLAQEVHSHHKRETVEEDVPVIYFPRATEGLKRRKREWAIPDINIPELDSGPFPKKASQILSLIDKDGVIHYSITGPGADQPPVGLFTMDKYSGILYVTQRLDREAISNYTLMAHAVAESTGSAEDPMELRVIVIDLNDNRPIFTQDTYTGQVAESSPLNFEILQVKATDADQEGTLNAAVHYRIMNQEPKSPADHMFAIDPVNGFIRVNAKGLDRAKNRKYTLEVQAADMEGEGLAGFTKVILTVTDSNDNAPIYTQTQFSASVEENTKDALVVKMSVTDEDDAHTPAWNAKFTIVDGNEDGLFTVATSANKQEGIITTAKGLDFEKISTHTLLVAVENEVPFAVDLPTSTATITVTVLDVNEAQTVDPAVVS